MKSKLVLSSFFLVLTACSQSGRPEAGALGGAALGAGTGAVIGHQTGHAGTGAAIGAGVGAASGAVVGGAIDEQERRDEEKDALLIRQEYELRRQQRELEDLRRQRYHDNQLRRYLDTHGGAAGQNAPQNSVYAPEYRNQGNSVSDSDRLY